jgi:hypothetical protein
MFFVEEDIYQWLEKQFKIACSNQPSVVLLDDFELIGGKKVDRDGLFFKKVYLIHSQ